MLDLRFFVEKFVLLRALLFWWHSLFVLFEVLSLASLEVKPNIGEGFHVRQESLDERMKLVLKRTE